MISYIILTLKCKEQETEVKRDWCVVIDMGGFELRWQIFQGQGHKTKYLSKK